MQVIKLLEKKEVIRLFGVGLILAPLFNSLLTLIAQPDHPGKWTWHRYFEMAMAGTNVQHVLDVCSIVIGFLLLTGSTQAWKYMLILLGGYMLMQLANLGHNMRANPLNGLFFVANVGLFLFIADQLAFKQKPPQKTRDPRSVQSFQKNAAPAPRPVAAAAVQAAAKPSAPLPFRRSNAKILVHFQGVGAWAQVMSISATGIELKSQGPAPIHIESREVEMELAPGFSLRARLKSRQGARFFFEYTHLPQARVQQLNQWILARTG